MSYEKVVQADKFLVGTKQTVKALKNGKVKEVIVAKDADVHIIEKVVNAAKESHTPITFVDSAKNLGEACRIDVGAATVALTD